MLGKICLLLRNYIFKYNSSKDIFSLFEVNVLTYSRIENEWLEFIIVIFITTAWKTNVELWTSNKINDDRQIEFTVSVLVD